MLKIDQYSKQEHDWMLVRLAQVVVLTLSIVSGMSIMSEDALLAVLIIGEINLAVDTIIMLRQNGELGRRLGTLILILGFSIWNIPCFFIKTQNKVCAVIYALVIGTVTGYIIQQF